MGIKQFLLQHISHFQRAKIKQEVITQIQNEPLFLNNDIVNIHRIDKNNAGDYYCAPHHYFKPLENKSLDIFDFKSTDEKVRINFKEQIINNSLIIGGGGLLNRGSFELQMKLFENISEKGKKTVLWGAGHNEKNKSNFGKVTAYNIDLSKFGLVGVRDYDMKYDWVPCVSCMNPIMETKNTIENETGLIYHKKTLKNKRLLKKLDNYPSISNTINIEEIIDFISKTETIVTDSYHAMYWSMLLGKRVVALPNSSKFYSFKYKPAFSDFENFEKEIKNAPLYTGVLEECREINMKFGKKVFDYLNL